MSFCSMLTWLDAFCSNCLFYILLHSFITKGSLGYLSSMYFSTSLVLGEVAAPFPEIESRESRTETLGGGGPPSPPHSIPPWSAFFSLSFSLTLYLPPYPSIYRYIYLSSCPSMYVFIYLSLDLSIYLSIYRCIDLSIYRGCSSPIEAVPGNRDSQCLRPAHACARARAEKHLHAGWFTRARGARARVKLLYI